VRTGGNAVIRQAISCDICGTEKKQTNHWFVAYDQGGELRVSGWNSRNRLRPGAKHLCGQTCLHKLVDEFMAKALRARPTQADSIDAAHEAELEVVERTARSDTSQTAQSDTSLTARSDTSLTSRAAFIDDDESSARLIPTPVPVTPARRQNRTPRRLRLPLGRRRAMPRATGARRPGSASGSANCAPMSAIRG
jgi:hypothetical protein